jgi:hypothetical protein
MVARQYKTWDDPHYINLSRPRSFPRPCPALRRWNCGGDPLANREHQVAGHTGTARGERFAASPPRWHEMEMKIWGCKFVDELAPRQAPIGGRSAASSAAHDSGYLSLLSHGLPLRGHALRCRLPPVFWTAALARITRPSTAALPGCWCWARMTSRARRRRQNAATRCGEQMSPFNS